MRLMKCRQCGAEVREGKACAEHLYDLLLGEPSSGDSDLEVAALFVVQHPSTHSAECLDLARRFLAARRSSLKGPHLN